MRREVEELRGVLEDGRGCGMEMERESERGTG